MKMEFWKKIWEKFKIIELNFKTKENVHKVKILTI